jgi:hypothetical protein
VPLTPEQFRILYPKIIGWIDLQLALHSGAVLPMSAAGFSRLSEYFGKDVLATARYVIVDKVPMPPLTRLGLPQFGEFERMTAAGITYRQTLFVQKEEAGRESLFFHELIHVVQWSLLGPENFLQRYAAGLEAAGYRNSPLEAMAYDAQERFESDRDAFDAALYVRKQLGVTL